MLSGVGWVYQAKASRCRDVRHPHETIKSTEERKNAGKFLLIRKLITQKLVIKAKKKRKFNESSFRHMQEREREEKIKTGLAS